MLTRDQISEFNRNGFLVVENVLENADLIPLEREYADLLDEIASPLFADGKVSSDFSEYSFAERFSRVVSECPEIIDRMNISLPLVNGEINSNNYQAHTGPAVFQLLRNKKILDLVESLIGSEIASSPVQQMRMKPPQVNLDRESVTHSGVGITTWHQDTVAVLPEADNTDQVTVWVAVTDATEENGCLVSIPQSHLEGAHRHVPGRIPREPTVPESIIAGRPGTPLPVGRGGLIMFHKNNIHCALPNRSDQFRWSVDIRYHPVGQDSGRSAFPGFVARSRENPESELHDPGQWNGLWRKARQRIIDGKYIGPIFKDWESG